MACQGPKDENIRIATASNMQYAIKKIAAVFQEQTGIKTELIIGSSGKLTAQIMEGAPYDVFVSADMKYPTTLATNELLLKPAEVYATGKLVLWSLIHTEKPSLSSLTDTAIQHIASANPQTAPYGRATYEVLQSSDVLDQVKHKLVYGESISQVNQFIATKSSEIGFTSLSSVLAPSTKAKGVWAVINEDLHSPIEQGAALIDRGKETKPAANQFYTFLFSPEAKTILKDFGYSIYE